MTKKNIMTPPQRLYFINYRIQKWKPLFLTTILFFLHLVLLSLEAEKSFVEGMTIIMLYVWLYMCSCVYVFMCAYVFVCVYVFMCVCLCVCGCMRVCVFLCVQAQLHTCAYACEGPRTASDASHRMPSSRVDQHSSFAGTSLIILDRLATIPRDLLASACPNPGIKSTYHSTQEFYTGSEFHTRVVILVR